VERSFHLIRLWYLPQGITRRTPFHKPARGSCFDGFSGKTWLILLIDEFVVAIENRGLKNASSEL
jgi:hypothetical protein